MKKSTTRQKRGYRWIRGKGMSALRTAARSYSVPRIVRATQQAFPVTRLVKHKYVDQVTLPAAAGANFTRSYLFKANGIFDPDTTGVGHQPMYHDQMIALYKYYTVIASYIKVTFNASDSTQQYYGIVCTQDTTLSATPSELIETYGYRKASLNTNRNYPLTLRASFDAKKKFRTDLKGIMSDTDQLTTSGSDPGSKQLFTYVLWSAPHDPAVTLAAQKVFVEINYVVLWQQPQDAVQS